ncbi:MAG: hypothetical protein Q8N18_10705 [Opitutaceae bacterium]|nr:hypothetical protein [Opitutaceae bacterium]
MTLQLANAANSPSHQGGAPGETEALQPCQVPISPPAETAWDEAFLRVESYLRAHHVESRVRLNQLATDIIREAREQARSRPGEAPVTTAMQVTHTRIGKWFGQAGHRGDWSDERVRVRGRLALLLAHTAALPGDGFLSSEPPPPRVAAALASGVLRPGPEIRFTNMPAAPLTFGFDDPGGPNSVRQSRGEVMRAAMVWLSIVAIYGVAWAASH